MQANYDRAIVVACLFAIAGAGPALLLQLLRPLYDSITIHPPLQVSRLLTTSQPRSIRNTLPFHHDVSLRFAIMKDMLYIHSLPACLQLRSGPSP